MNSKSLVLRGYGWPIGIRHTRQRDSSTTMTAPFSSASRKWSADRSRSITCGVRVLCNLKTTTLTTRPREKAVISPKSRSKVRTIRPSKSATTYRCRGSRQLDLPALTFDVLFFATFNSESVARKQTRTFRGHVPLWFWRKDKDFKPGGLSIECHIMHYVAPPGRSRAVAAGPALFSRVGGTLPMEVHGPVSDKFLNAVLTYRFQEIFLSRVQKPVKDGYDPRHRTGRQFHICR